MPKLLMERHVTRVVLRACGKLHGPVSDTPGEMIVPAFDAMRLKLCTTWPSFLDVELDTAGRNRRLGEE
jgi:hypothetical protein